MCHNPAACHETRGLNILSADTPKHEANLSRGQAVFAVDALESALNTVSSGMPLPQAALTDYATFYGFDLLLTDVEHEVRLLPVDAHEVVVHIFKPDAPKGYALLCHGYYDHVGLYGHVIRYLTERGIVVVGFDQIGHGLSSGERASVDSFSRYVRVTETVYRYARQHLQVPEGIAFHWVGQSMGGAIVMETLHQHQDIEAGHVVLFAPLIRPYAWWFSRWVYAAARRTIDSRPRRITTNASNVEFIRLQHADPLQPDILPVQWVGAMVEWFERFETYTESDLAPRIIQGEQDKTIDWRYGGKVISRRYPNSRWCRLPEASHHLVNESLVLREQMWAWLDEHCDWSTSV